MAVWALLTAGEDPQNVHLAKAIDFLKTAPITGTYALSLRLCAWEQLPDRQKIHAVVEHDANLLLSYMKTEGDAAGLFGYPGALTGGVIDPGGYFDHSNSQFALLGLWAAQQCGAEIPDAVFTQIEQAWRRHQRADGGWGYTASETMPTTASMTAAGVASLFLLRDLLHGHEGVDCNGNAGTGGDPAIEKGIAWLTDHWGQVNNNYTWFGVSRIGIASGQKYLDKLDWFKEGAQALVPEDAAYGKGGGVGFMPGTYISDTSFALLFLARGGALSS